MSDIARWGIFLAAAITIIGIVVAFPIMDYMDLGVFQSGIDTILSVMGDALIFGRGLINNFLSPWARTAASGLMCWFLGKWFLTYTIRITVWAYKWVFG